MEQWRAGSSHLQQEPGDWPQAAAAATVSAAATVPAAAAAVPSAWQSTDYSRLPDCPHHKVKGREMHTNESKSDKKKKPS